MPKQPSQPETPGKGIIPFMQPISVSQAFEVLGRVFDLTVDELRAGMPQVDGFKWLVEFSEATKLPGELCSTVFLLPVGNYPDEDDIPWGFMFRFDSEQVNIRNPEEKEPFCEIQTVGVQRVRTMGALKGFSDSEVDDEFGGGWSVEK